MLSTVRKLIIIPQIVGKTIQIAIGIIELIFVFPARRTTIRYDYTNQFWSIVSIVNKYSYRYALYNLISYRFI